MIVLPAGAFLTTRELRLLLDWAKVVRSAHVRNGGGSSPSLTLADEIYNAANGIKQVGVYNADGTLVGVANSADISIISADRLVDNAGSAQIPTLLDDRGETKVSGWITAQEAADRLGNDVRRVTQLLTKGLLVGRQKVARGTWLVSAESVNQRAEQQRRAS